MDGKKRDHPDSFFMSMRPVLIVGQIGGVLPIHGTTGSYYGDLRFSWINWQFIYIGILFFASLFINVISSVDNISSGIRLDNFGSTIFYSVCNLNVIFFVDLARKWRDICRKVHNLENSMAEYGYPSSMGLRIKIFLAVFLALSSFEHGLLVYLNVLGALAMAENEQRDFMDCFFQVRFPVVRNNVAYSDFTVIFVMIVTVIGTLNWNYLDFFLISLSMEICAKLSQFNQRLKKLGPTAESDLFWRKMRVDYNGISLLTKELEAIISKLVFMSYVSNLYHLSLQLLRSLKFKGDNPAMIYFFFSMGYLMLRILTVSLCAARIEEESKKPKDVLFALKAPGGEALRLLEQVLFDEICWTGKRFFSVNRRFIVAMVGTLVTYEIILLQLNSLRYDEHQL